MRGYPDITILVTSVLWLFIISVVRRRPVLRLFMFMGSVTCNQCSLWHEG